MRTQRYISWRFFITYLCIALPILTISILLSSYSMHQMQEDDKALLENRLQSITNGLEECFTQYYESSAYLANVPELSPAHMLSNAVNARKGLRVLETVYAFDATISELVLFYDADHLFGSAGMARASVYLSSELKLTGDAYALAMSALTSEHTSAMCLKTGAGAGYVLFHFPEHFASSTMTVNVLMDFSVFAQKLQSMIGDEDTHIMLSFPQGEKVCFAWEKGGLRPISEGILSQSTADGGWISADGQASLLNVGVRVLINERQLYANVIRLQNVNYLVLILGMLLSSSLSVLFTSRRMTQLKSLEAAVAGGMDAQPHLGEFSNIHTLIRNAVNQNVAALANFRAILRRQTAKLMFHGLLKEKREYEPLLEKCGIELTEDFEFVVAFYAEGMNPEELLEGRLFCAEEIAGCPVWIYLEELPNPDEQKKLRLTHGQRLCRQLLDRGARRVRVVLSGPVNRIDTLDYAYLRSLDVLAQQLHAEDAEEITFVDGTDEENAPSLPPPLLDEFSSALMDFNGTRALQTLRKMLQLADDETPERRQYLQYSLVQQLIKALTESETPKKEDFLNTLENIRSSGERDLGEQLLLLTEEFCNQKAWQGNGEKMVRYLQQNFSREDLTLDQMAEHFGLSREYMSRLFRACTGTRYMDYLTRLRMEEAWKLLTTTDLSSADIFRQVGYLDRSSGTRKFKKYFGVTPGEVRHQEETVKD